MKNLRQHSINIYMWLIVAAGTASVLHAAVTLPTGIIDGYFLLLTLITAVLGSRIAIRIPKISGNITLEDTFVFIALLLYGGEAAVNVPLVGRIAAGTPIEALQNKMSDVPVPGGMLGRGNHYALEVTGDSMINAGILDGDTVIIQESDSATTGEIIVALVDNEEATLKRLRRRGDSIALEAANPAYETRLYGADRVKVQGKLVGLIRRY